MLSARRDSLTSSDALLTGTQITGQIQT